MEGRRRKLTMKAQSVLLLVAIVAALTPLSRHSYFATQAQTEPAESLGAPVLSTPSTDANRVELRWTAVSGAVRYELWVWDSVNDWQQLDDGSLTGTSFTHSGITPGTTYWYAVRAVDAGGATSAWSEHTPATVPSTQPATPGVTPTPTDTAAQLPTPTPTPTQTATQTPTPSATVAALTAPMLSAKAGNSAIELRWPQVAGAARYELWSWTEAGGWQQLDDGALTGNTHSHSGLTPGTTYWYAVRAVDAGGATSAWSEQVAATFTGTTVTEEPTSTATASALSRPDLSATAGDSVIELRWPRVAGAARYELWSWTEAGGWQQLDDGALTGNTYTHSGLTPGTTYWYTVRAVDAAGATGAWSEQTSATVSGGSAPTSTATATPTVTASPTVVPMAAPAEREVLIALYEATDGANWSRSDDWLSGAPVGTWYGVSTDSSGRVTRLSLSHNKLSGPIPDLSALTRLTTLSLHSNQLTGSIPDLSALAQLTNISLSYNQLSGSIPDLGALTNLVTLSLYNNRLSGPIPDLSALSNLQTLSLSDNQLTGQIPDLSTLTNLQSLSLGHNQLTGTVPNLSALTNLTTLFLYSNRLTGIVPDLSALSNLSKIDLSHNRLGGPIPDLTALPLRQLNLSGNRFCLPEGLRLSGPNTAVTAHLRDLNLQPCPDDTFPATPTATATPLPGATQTPTPTATRTAPASAEERDTLVALYNATDGASWTRSDNWLSEAPVGTWYGVSTDSSGRVTRLSLSHNEMSGPIPDLSALTRLTTLSLHSNQLTGSIPDLSALAQLTNISLSYNQLSGSIPDLKALTNLATLSLFNNQLTGQIPDLSALTNLQTLSLSGNQLTGQIPDLSALTNLTYLSLGHNQLTGPVPNLSALTNLSTLSLYGNSLCLPGNFDLAGLNDDVAGSLLGLFLPSCGGGPALLPSSPAEERAALVALYEATDGANWTRNDNWLSDAPVATWAGVTIDGRGRVTELYLEDNGLRGSIPNLDALTSLWYLDLGHNQLSGRVPDLSALTSLEILALGSSQLSGPFPDLSALTSLRKLYLSNNQLSGSVPDLSALSNLEFLSLGFNQLSGSFPDLSALTNLWNLSLNNNQLSGRIPDLSALTNLWYLEISSNRLSGPIPDLSALTSLRELSLYNNQLSGSVPDLSALTSLRWLSFSGNRLRGSIPDLGALTNLTTLSLYNNQLTGSVPDLSALTNLTRLSLYNNQLSGSIPDLSTLTNLTNLSLSRNQFTGPVPDLSALINLTYLSLSGNRLCLPEGFNLSGANQVVVDHLNGLNLATCTASELPAVPEVPQNLTATVGAGQVTLRWDAVANAASYELWAYDSIKRAWARIGGALTGRSYTHPVLTDGRNYYFQVRAWDGGGVRGAWSKKVFAAVVPQQFLPPPPSLGINTLLYQKYVDVDGVGVAAPSEVADEQLVHGQGIIRGMLSSRPDLLKELVANGTMIFIDVYRSRGIAFKLSGGWEAYVPERDPVPHCGTFIHELAHLIHFAIEDLPGGPAFNTRLQGLYQAARTAGRWRGLYASTNYKEYWAEAVRIWLHESMPPSLAPYHPTLADYDPEAAKLVEEVFGDATVPAACKP